MSMERKISKDQSVHLIVALDAQTGCKLFIVVSRRAVGGKEGSTSSYSSTENILW